MALLTSDCLSHVSEEQSSQLRGSKRQQLNLTNSLEILSKPSDSTQRTNTTIKIDGAPRAIDRLSSDNTYTAGHIHNACLRRPNQCFY